MTDSRQLLTQYVTESSEIAFRELVGRYIDLVFSTALRLVEGDAHCAQDVVQLVFLDLARQAPKLAQDTMLGGWLHRDTCFVASKIMRGQRRRQLREQQAAEMNALHNTNANLTHIAPVLDEAINQLAEDDRKAILLRFYERRDLRSVGQALGSSENAAQKRVARALDQLHFLLTKRGVALSAAGLGTVLAAEAITAAPVGLSASVATSALAGSGAAGGVTLSALKTIIMTKLKLGTISALIIGGLGTSVIVQHRSLASLQEDNRALQKQLQELRDSNQALASHTIAQPDLEKSRRDQADLARLRGEVTALRQAVRSGAAPPASPNKAAEQGASTDKTSGENKLHANVHSQVPNGQTLLTGGWTHEPGKRVFVLATPRVWTPTGQTAQRDASAQVEIKTRVFEIPETSLAQAGLDAFTVDGSESSLNHVLAAPEAQSLLKKLENIQGAKLIAQSSMLTSDGRQAQIQTQDEQVDGAQQPLNPILDITPVVSSDNASVELTLQAGINKPSREAH